MKNTKLRVVAILLSILCLVPLISCNKNESKKKKEVKQKQIKESREIKLPYAYSQEDSLNPYFSKSLINKCLMPLIYDSLFTLDKSYEPKPSVASSGKVIGSIATVTINTDKKFADGSYITADDILASFNLAKTSVFYSANLANVEKAEIKSPTELEFKLNLNDAFAISCLDFPIVKSGTTADSSSMFPTASGKYEVVYEGNKRCLKVNDNYEGFNPEKEKVELVNITDSNAINYSLAIGNIDGMFTDLSQGTYERINAGTQKVLMNNIVFLGINKNNTKLKDIKLRQAINTLLDREKIVNEGFQGYATEAYTLFNPQWYKLKSMKQPGKDTKKSDAEKYIQENTKNLNLRLLVNEDNKFKDLTATKIAELLKSTGINITVQKMSFDEYNKSVTRGNYDLYLGEMKLTNNMNLYKLLNPKTPSYDSYLKLQDGTKNMQEFLIDYYSQMPIIPLCYRNGVLAFSRNIPVEVKSEENDIFKNLGDWYIK